MQAAAATAVWPALLARVLARSQRKCSAATVMGRSSNLWARWAVELWIHSRQRQRQRRGLVGYVCLV